MTTYNTGNTLGSADPRDLYDNAGNLDKLTNGQALTYADRLGVPRKSLAGMAADFQSFLLASGYQDLGAYAAGLNITARNQVVLKDGEYYRMAASASVPYTLTGVWATDSPDLVGVGDAVLRQEISNYTDPAKGAAGIGRATRQINSMAELRTVAGRYDGDQAALLGYHVALPGVGAGTFRWAAASTAADDGGTVIQASGVVTGRWLRVFEGSAHVTWFGAKGDGVDDTAAMAAAHATAHHIHYPAGKYLTTATVVVKQGCLITGVGEGRYTTDPKKVSWIEHATAGALLFDREASTATGQEEAFSIVGCYLLADQCVRMNDPTITISEVAPCPHLMRPRLYRCTFQAKTPDTGVGVSMSKCFDHVITECEFRQHDIQLLMQGCDIGEIHANRFTLFKTNAILELSAGNYGSQNKIYNNDILAGTSAATVFIKTTARHIRIYDNYLEHGQARDPIKGFIDASLVGAPVYGANVSEPALSVVIRDNRIDGHNKVTDWVYRIQPAAFYLQVRDCGASGDLAVLPARELSITTGYLPLCGHNPLRLAMYDIAVPGQQNVSFTSFRTQPITGDSSGIVINAQNILSLNHAELRRNGMQQQAYLAQGALVVGAGVTSSLHLVLPEVDALNNVWLASGATYTATVVARAAVAGQTLEILPVKNASGSAAAITPALTTQLAEYTVSVPGGLATDTVGVALKRTGTISGNVFVQSITFKKV